MNRVARLSIAPLTALAVACAGRIGPPLAAPGEPVVERGVVATTAAQPSPPTAPGVDWEQRLARIDELVSGWIVEGNIPGCVVLVGRHDGVLFRRAYGSRALVPDRELMTEDTIFDLASLTKPIATATSIAILVERGLVDLDAPAATYVPELSRHGKGAMTIRDLLLHVSGLPPEAPLSAFEHGRAHAMDAIYALATKTAPGEKLVYSDVGYLVLEEVVRRVAGEELDVFARDNVFAPLGMKDTSFLPDAALLPRIAPTELREGAIIRGLVHDPRAWKLGGVAGNAGLFATADDLGRFARALLDGGQLEGARVLESKTVDKMLAPHDVAGGVRALGWDVRSAYSGNGGDSLSARAVGHGGYTGTSLWIDRAKDLFVVVLSNRVHPSGQGAVNLLAGRITNVAADAVAPEAALAPSCPAPGEPVLAGVDVLRARDFDLLEGARVGLVTNVTGRAKDGGSTASLLARAHGVELVALFAPEHGLAAKEEGKLDEGRDPETGLPVHSLYGETLTPTSAALQGIDTLVFDVQDVGTRFYTYASTMHRAMRAAADAGIRFVVLDRPDPIGGVDVEGPLLASVRGFVNHYALPVRHGMTLGELARMIDADEHLGLALTVVPVSGWHREAAYDATGLPWVSPSPNLRSVGEELLYPGIGLLEGTNVSVGRGTDAPFEVVGAPFVDEGALAAALAKEAVPGVRFDPLRFTPDASTHKGLECGGVRVVVNDRTKLDPVRTGLAIARALAALYPEDWHEGDLQKLVQSQPIVDAVKAGKTLDAIMALVNDGLGAWRAKREKYLLYPYLPCAPAPAETAAPSAPERPDAVAGN